MRMPKRYGESRRDPCPFCGRQATATSEQGVPVCTSHKSAVLPEMKCVCGSYLEMKKGKFGVFYTCIDCGNLSSAKVFEFNEVRDVSGVKQGPEKKASLQDKNPEPARRSLFASVPEKKNPREIVVRADDPFYCS